MKTLSTFLHSFDLAKLHPDKDFVKSSPGVVARVLSNPGQAYALYMEGRFPTELSLDLPVGRWKIDWGIEPLDPRRNELNHPGGLYRLTTLAFEESGTLCIVRIGN